MNRLLTSVAATAFVIVTSSPALAGSATGYVIHGINGADLGADPGFPVDVSVNGDCALTELMFGDIAGPLKAKAPASYDIEIGAANIDVPCSNDPVIVANGLPLLFGQTATVIAHLNETGQPTASLFNNNVRELDDAARISVHHTAAAVPVDVIVEGVKTGTVTIEDLANGEQAVTKVPPGTYQLTINVANTDVTVFGPETYHLKEERSYFAYAVGTPENDTFQLLAFVIGTDDDNWDDD